MTSEQPELFDPLNDSLQPARLRHAHSERIYLELWQRHNRRCSSVNRGYTALEWLLCPDGAREPRRAASQAEATTAACFAQWLGTNCGLGFVRMAEGMISEAGEFEHHVAAESWRRLVAADPRWTDPHLRQARLLLAPVSNHPAYDRVLADVAARLAMAPVLEPLERVADARGILVREVAL